MKASRAIVAVKKGLEALGGLIQTAIRSLSALRKDVKALDARMDTLEALIREAIGAKGSEDVDSGTEAAPDE